MMKFQWIGGPTFLAELGSFRILTDPMLAEGEAAFIMNGHPSTGADNVPIARLAPLPTFGLSGLECVIISHLHSDHFDQVAASRLPKESPLIAPLECVASLKAQQFQNVFGLRWGDEKVLRKNGEQLRIVSVPARHSHDDRTNRDLGVVNGYILQHSSNGQFFTIYWTGDTVWFDELARIKHRYPRIDLLVPHLGAVGEDGPWGLMTFNSLEAIRLVELFKPEAVIPIHHHTFSHYVEPVSVFQEQINASAYQSRLIVLKEGQSIQFETDSKMD
jgi:L-ascorbate metabolism protein UlaG (beta-lactamase superfamily)